MITCKIIHSSPERSDRSSMRPTQNYLNRRNFLFENTLPALAQMNIDASFFDAIMYLDLDFDRSLEGVTHDPKKRIEHNGRFYLIDNPFPSAYEIALCMGHLSLWEYCINIGKPLLIMEDDVLVKTEYSNNILSSISEFCDITDPAILYLQATHTDTPNPKTKLKYYDPNFLEKRSTLFKVSSSYYDWSGTAAYAVNPSGAKKLIERSELAGIRTPDGFVHRAISEKYLDPYIPVQYTNSVLLHPDYS